MIGRFLRITGTTAFMILCMLLPFLPGQYDPLAVPLSMLPQTVGTVGLLLVPVGALWLAAEHWSRLAPIRLVFAITALIASSLVWGFASLFWMTESLVLGLAAFGLGGYAVTRILPRLWSLRSATRNATVRPASALPVYLIILPLALALTRFGLGDRVTELSRNRAIRNSAPMIADIEAYRAANGRYPPSTVSVHPDYKPSIIGIREYRYEPSGDAYNVLFEQHSFRFGTQEIVMYNPRDQQAIASHALDVLQLTPEQLALDRTRGHYAVHTAAQPHWKYFWFD
jgi:hypothetical protein